MVEIVCSLPCMKPFGSARSIAEDVSEARDDLTQMRQDFHQAVQVFTVLAVVISVALVLAVLKEG